MAMEQSRDTFSTKVVTAIPTETLLSFTSMNASAGPTRNY